MTFNAITATESFLHHSHPPVRNISTLLRSYGEKHARWKLTHINADGKIKMMKTNSFEFLKLIQKIDLFI